eukprot:GHVT01088364.1.p1 GENE.GHVT01088364.1~~GHVT01088364.1.p1  ORF type:complete len:684 (-),score=70.29 GHVT01088364.1:283-2253(-)
MEKVPNHLGELPTIDTIQTKISDCSSLSLKELCEKLPLLLFVQPKSETLWVPLCANGEVSVQLGEDDKVTMLLPATNSYEMIRVSLFEWEESKKLPESVGRQQSSACDVVPQHTGRQSNSESESVTSYEGPKQASSLNQRQQQLKTSGNSVLQAILQDDSYSTPHKCNESKTRPPSSFGIAASSTSHHRPASNSASARRSALAMFHDQRAANQRLAMSSPSVARFPTSPPPPLPHAIAPNSIFPSDPIHLMPPPASSNAMSNQHSSSSSAIQPSASEQPTNSFWNKLADAINTQLENAPSMDQPFNLSQFPKHLTQGYDNAGMRGIYLHQFKTAMKNVDSVSSLQKELPWLLCDKDKTGNLSWNLSWSSDSVYMCWPKENKLAVELLPPVEDPVGTTTFFKLDEKSPKNLCELVQTRFKKTPVQSEPRTKIPPAAHARQRPHPYQVWVEPVKPEHSNRAPFLLNRDGTPLPRAKPSQAVQGLPIVFTECREKTRRRLEQGESAVAFPSRAVAGAFNWRTEYDAAGRELECFDFFTNGPPATAAPPLVEARHQVDRSSHADVCPARTFAQDLQHYAVAVGSFFTLGLILRMVCCRKQWKTDSRRTKRAPSQIHTPLQVEIRKTNTGPAIKDIDGGSSSPATSFANSSTSTSSAKLQK